MSLLNPFEKMSGSQPKTAIYLDDTEELIRRKIQPTYYRFRFVIGREQTYTGWQEVINEEGKTRSKMLICTPSGSDNWDTVSSFFSKISEILKRFSLTHVANVSISASVLTIALHSQAEHMPASFVRASDELSNAIVGKA